MMSLSKCMTQIGDRNKPCGAHWLRCQFCTGRLFSAQDSGNHQSLWFRMSKGDFSLIANWFWGGVFTCEGEAITREQTWLKKNEGGGLIPMDCHKEIWVKTPPTPVFLCIILWRGLSVSRLRACHRPSMQTSGLASAWLHCLHPPLNMLQARCPFGPTPPTDPSIHPLERWGRVCGPHCWPVRTRASFCYL